MKLIVMRRGEKMIINRRYWRRMMVEVNQIVRCWVWDVIWNMIWNEMVGGKDNKDKGDKKDEDRIEDEDKGWRW